MNQRQSLGERWRSRAKGVTVSKNARMWIAGGVALALVSTIAVIANGYDARETPRAEAGVWVARDAGQYARVNTDTGELDIVRKVAEPSGLLQSSGRGVVFSNGNGRAWPIDASNPVDFGDEAKTDKSDSTGAHTVATPADGTESEAEGATAVRLPEGTRDIVGAGRFVGLLAESGAAYLGELADSAGSGGAGSGGAGATAAGAKLEAQDLAGRLGSLREITPLTEGASGASTDADAADADANATDADSKDADSKGAEQRKYQADAIAVSTDGEVALYSAAENAVRRFDVASGESKGDADPLPAAAKDVADPQLALVGDSWVLFDAKQGRLWRKGVSETKLKIEGAARLQASGGAQPGAAVLVADTGGLWRITQNGTAKREIEAKGIPAQPIEVDGKMYAAWLGQRSGELWQDGEGKTTPLQFDDSVREKGDLEPVFRSNGERAVLSEAKTGMLWGLPDGALIPLAQWSISDPPKEDRGTVVVDEITDPLPPTAVGEALGVRAGQPAQLPVLLNDFDPNKRDVLTIVPESLGESPLPAAFGSLQLMPDGQSLIVQTAAKASGSATFTYRITDGALTSEAATVTLTVVGEETNTAPAWCPVEGCQREWRVPAIAPGGTLVYPILEGWVDPEGDVMMLSGVEIVRHEDPVRATVTADGKLAVRHTDPNAGASELMLRVSVRDAHGEQQQRDLQLAVRPDAPPEFAGTAATVTAGELSVLQPLLRVAGGSGSYALINATAQGTTNLQVTPRLIAGTVEVTASEPGSATLSLNVRDTVTGVEITGALRVTATTSEAALALPPLRAFVRPLSDSTVEVLDAIPNSHTRALSVSAAEVVDGELRADVIEHAKVRVAGNTPDGGPGRVGAVNVTVAEGDALTRGRLTVFQVPESGSSGAIAVADTASVRAGSITDIRILDNDIAPPGDRLLLHPKVSGSDTKGELVFASGNVLRYLAPRTPGTYRLSYTTYGANTPELSDVGAVYVTVLPEGANKDPQPRTLTARVAPGEQTEVRVPLSGVDPDGDRIRLLSVASPDDASVTASVSGSRVIVAASDTAKPGKHEVNYTVRDDFHASAKGKLYIVVMSEDTQESAPIAATDQVRMAPNSSEPAVVQPLDNDIDPARGKLSIVAVEPSVPGGKNSAEYKQLAARLDLSEMKKGRLSLRSVKEIGTAAYRYTIKSSATSSTSDGLIVVQTSERVGAQAPTIDDTVLNVGDRAALSGSGVDVTTDKVRWSTGDASALKLSLWAKSTKNYRVDGNRIVGQYNPDGDLVIFKLTGKDITGADVSSYGFLMVPPLDELRLSLKVGMKPLSVDEGKSVESRVQDLVDLGSGDRAELRQSDFGVARSQASCSAVSSSAVRYTAGKEAPWNDTCLISVRLVGQKTWTSLPVPVTIRPREPIVQLSPLTRTIAPGESETIRLSDMVTWQGGRAGDLSKLRFEVSGRALLFDVESGDGTVKVTAQADSRPGSQEVQSISASGMGESRAPLSLRVGEAPKEGPKGGSLKLNCEVGKECNADLLGIPGQYDPFAGKSGGGLKLASIDTTSCQVGTFSRVGESGIAVSWSDSAGAGGICSVGFDVLDAQGRTGQGKIEFDASGFPAAPSSITQTDFSATSVTFAVSLGGQAHPKVTGVSVSAKDVGSTNCAIDGDGGSYQCVVTGLSNGVKHSFTATASNARGNSPASTAVEAWAYEVPKPPKVTLSAIKKPGSSDSDHGDVHITIEGSSDTGTFRVTAGSSSEPIIIPGPVGATDIMGLAVGRQSVRVAPLTAFEVPKTGSASNAGDETSWDVEVRGAPRLESVSLSSKDATSATIEYSPQSAEGVTYGFGIALKGSGSDPSCSNALGGGPAYANLNNRGSYQAVVCASSDYGKTVAFSESLKIGGPLGDPKGEFTYRVDQSPSRDLSTDPMLTSAEYKAVAPNLTLDDGGTVLQYEVDGKTSTEFSLNAEKVEQMIRVRQCIGAAVEDSCSEWREVTAASTTPTAPTTVKVSAIGASTACYSPPTDPAIQPDQEELKKLLTISTAARQYAEIAVGSQSALMVPLTVTWNKGSGSPFSPLEAVIINVNVCTTP